MNEPPSPDRPNVLWVTFEDTSPRFGCYGDPVARTPHADRLASEGCRYPNAFSVAGVCAPSRHAVITGMYPTSTGAQHMRATHTNAHTPSLPTPYEAVPPHYARLLPEYLRAAGYYCTNAAKTDYQFACPVTAWDELSDAAHWRNRPDPAQPFFAVFNLNATHESGMWDDEARAWKDKPGHGPLETDPAAVEVPPYLPDTEATRAAIARQYDNVAHNDALLGRYLEQLEADGLAESTIVMVWSDHGEGLPRRKRWPYDGGIHVPLIVRAPGRLAPGSVDERLVSMIDLPPTVLSLAGAGVPGHMQGTPFLGPDAGERDHVFASRDRYDETYDMMRAVRDRRYKYIRNFDPTRPYIGWLPFRDNHPVMRELWRLHAAEALSPEQARLFGPRPAEELYDLASDPHELTNLAADPGHAETRKRLSRALDAWRRESGDLGDLDEAEMVRRWYLVGRGEQPVTGSPVPVAYGAEAYGREPAEGGGTYRGPLLVQLHCATQGAAIVWTTEPGDDARWSFYTGPIRLSEKGRHLLRAKAQRVGYKPSEERGAVFVVA